VSRAALLAAVAVLASCAVADHGIAFDQDDVDARELHREHLAEWCRMVGPCESGRGGLVPLAPLPAYTEACGYLPPVYGDDC
jgi:hypothetical protein